MKTQLTILAAIVLGFLAGCRSTVEGRRPAGAHKGLPAGEKVLLTVDFQQGRTLEYRFASSRDIVIDWDPNKSPSTAGKENINKQSEALETVVAYTPVQVDSYGLTTINATCKWVKAMRTRGPGGRAAGADAVESLIGRSFTFTVSPSGKIKDYSELDKLIRQTGEKVFRSDTSKGRIKDPDMIGDFIASQWFLWDSVSSITNPSAGVAVGQTWTSKLSVPTPMVMRQARDVTYKLDQIRQAEQSKLAVIHASYKLAQRAPQGWPVPYSGRFQMSGTFGFLGPYEVLDLQGQGEELFNIDTGRLQKYDQQYTLRLKASLPPLGISAKPYITITQKLTMELLNP